MHDPVQGAKGVMGAPSGPEAIRTVQKVLLVHRLQHLADGVLDQLVLERRYPNRPRLPLCLRDVDPSDRLMAIPLRPQPRMEVLESRLQVPPIRLLRDPIHTHRRILALASVGSGQGRHINEMRQRVESSLGLAIRPFHYLPEFR